MLAREWGKITQGLWAILPPKMQQRTLKNKKEPLKIAIDCNVYIKSLFNVVNLVNGMWKVAPEKKKI